MLDYRVPSWRWDTYIRAHLHEVQSERLWRLLKKDNNLYDAIDAGRHNNDDEEIVLLLKVPEDIEIDECCGDG